MIPVYKPFLGEREKNYVNQCLDSSWISSKGEFINRFEQKFAEYIQINYASTVANGTVALHLALTALDLKPNDEVIVPTLTYIASVNTIVQAGARPVFVDSLGSSWQMDPENVAKKITAKTKAIMAVHLYGQACEMHALQKLCKQHNLYLIEDCAEAFGSYYHNQHVGTFGDISSFSFFGNKTITTGEGGMVVANDSTLMERVNHLKNQGVSKVKEYWHESIAFNYRMTNICAAIGLAQLEQAPEILAKKQQIAQWYQTYLQELPIIFHPQMPNTIHSYWMCSVLTETPNQRNQLRQKLQQANIETRPLFYPIHTLPPYQSNQIFPVAEGLSARGINLPSYPALTEDQIKQICDIIKDFVKIKEPV